MSHLYNKVGLDRSAIIDETVSGYYPHIRSRRGNFEMSSLYGIIEMKVHFPECT